MCSIICWPPCARCEFRTPLIRSFSGQYVRCSIDPLKNGVPSFSGHSPLVRFIHRSEHAMDVTAISIALR
jgi:hypothetical protein